MIVGLPGTGIGGLFYLLLVALMPLHEIVLTLRGRSSWRRWRFVLRHLALAAGIVGSLYGAWWALQVFFTFLGAHHWLGLDVADMIQGAILVSARTASLAALAVLLAVVGGSAVLARLMRRAPPAPLG